MSSPSHKIRKLIDGHETSVSKPTDGEWIAIGLLAVAQSIDVASVSLNGLANCTGHIAAALRDGLGDIEVAIRKIADALPGD